MKRFFLLTTLLILLVVSLAPVFAAEAPSFVLNNNDTISRFSALTSGAVVIPSTTTFTFSPANSDPTVTLSLGEKEQFSADENPFVALKMSVKSTITVGGFFFPLLWFYK